MVVHCDQAGAPGDGSGVGRRCVCPVELRDGQLRQALLVRCRAERVEPPGRIDRIIGSARTTFEKRFCERTVSRLSKVSIARLNNLVAIGAAPLASGRNLLAELKSDPGKVRLETLLREVDKLSAVRALELPADLCGRWPRQPVSGQMSRSATAFPGPGRRWVTNSGPRVRLLISRGSSLAVPASQ